MKNTKLFIFLTLLFAMATPIECFRGGRGGRGGFRGGRGYRGHARRYRPGWRGGGVGFSIGFGAGYPGRYYRRPYYRRPYRYYRRPYVGVGFGWRYPYWNWYGRYNCDYCYDQPNTVYYVQDTSKKRELESRVKHLEEQLKEARDTQRIKTLHQEIYEAKRAELERILVQKEREYQEQIDNKDTKQAQKTREIIRRLNKDMQNMRKDFNKMMRDLDRNPVESKTKETSY